MNLKRDLGLVDLFCIATGTMISSGLFILPGLAFSKVGPSVIVSYVIAGILIIPAMLSTAELGTALPKTGGTYFFIDRSMGPLFGTLGGLADWISLSLKSAFALLGIGLFVTALSPSLTEMQVRAILVACCIFFTAINVVGVKVTGKVQVAMVAGLLLLLVSYVVLGSFSVSLERYTPFMPAGLPSVITTAGLVFVSYSGLTKVVDVAEEIKHPGRNLPLAMLLSLATVGALYTLTIFVTVGVVDAGPLQHSVTPVTLGARTFLGWGGEVAMGIAAILAFATTANGGILVSSRTPLAMSKDRLLPGQLQKISKRGTPAFSILLTCTFMVFILLFLNLESLAEAASTVTLLLYMFVNFSLIFMREGKIRHYNPTFRSPLYPWVQVGGIAGYVYLIVEMGTLPLVITGVFLLAGLCWYGIYVRGKAEHEYAFLHVFGRIRGVKLTHSLLEMELRRIADGVER